MWRKGGGESSAGQPEQTLLSEHRRAKKVVTF